VGRRQHPPNQGDADRHRRRRGGQPGNVNAWKNGLYSHALSPEALRALQIARTLKEHDLTEEIAALRARTALLDPSDTEAFTKGIAILIRAVRAHHRMSPVAVKNLSEAMSRTLEELGDAFGLPAAGADPGEP
jgi:hypothetical protein